MSAPKEIKDTVERVLDDHIANDDGLHEAIFQTLLQYAGVEDFDHERISEADQEKLDEMIGNCWGFKVVVSPKDIQATIKFMKSL